MMYLLVDIIVNFSWLHSEGMLVILQIDDNFPKYMRHATKANFENYNTYKEWTLDSLGFDSMVYCLTQTTEIDFVYKCNVNKLQSIMMFM